MRSKNSISVIIVYAVILAAFNMLYFMIPFPKSSAAWVCYGFMTLSIFISYGTTNLAFIKDTSLRSRVYGISIFKLGISYISIQFALTIAILSIGFGVIVAPWIPAAISVVNLAYVLIGVVVKENARDHVGQQQQAIYANTRKMKSFRIDIAHITEKCKDAELKRSLSALSDDFKYSDPVSADELTEIENQLQIQVKVLEELVNTDNEQAAQKIDEIKIMLADRNRRCKALKM